MAIGHPSEHRRLTMDTRNTAILALLISQVQPATCGYLAAHQRIIKQLSDGISAHNERCVLLQMVIDCWGCYDTNALSFVPLVYQIFFIFLTMKITQLYIHSWAGLYSYLKESIFPFIFMFCGRENAVCFLYETTVLNSDERRQSQWLGGFTPMATS